MSLKKIFKDQPDEFKFSEENKKVAEKIILNYPDNILAFFFPLFSSFI